MAARESFVEGANNLRAIPKILLELAVYHLEEIEHGKYGTIHITESARNIGTSRMYSCYGRTFEEVNALNPKVTKKNHYNVVAHKQGCNPAVFDKIIPDDEVLRDPFVENKAFQFEIITDGVPIGEIGTALITVPEVLRSVGFTLRDASPSRLPGYNQTIAVMDYTGTNYIEIGDGLNSPELNAFLRILYEKHLRKHYDCTTGPVYWAVTRLMANHGCADTTDLRNATRYIKDKLCAVDRTKDSENPRLGCGTLAKLLNDCLLSEQEG